MPVVSPALDPVKARVFGLVVVVTGNVVAVVTVGTVVAGTVVAGTVVAVVVV
jgi:hypothetical protein